MTDFRPLRDQEAPRSVPGHFLPESCRRRHFPNGSVQRDLGASSLFRRIGSDTIQELADVS
jgi:hypothetical protein